MRHLTMTTLLGALMLSTPSAVNAAGLGKLTVISAIGQPLQAEIDLVSVPKGTVEALSVRLVSPDEYKQAGLNFNGIVANLKLQLEKRANGQPYIKVTSNRPANEFVLDLVVDLNWSTGRHVREYRVMLDLPALGPAPMIAESSRSVPRVDLVDRR